MPVAAFVSFRFGELDGVSVEAQKWEWALQRLGFATYRVAGSFGGRRRADDVVVPWLGLVGDADVPDAPALRRALAPADLVVVENLLSLPLNLPASRALRRILQGLDVRVVLHHHDLPWQRPHLPQPRDFPPPLQNAVHVTINHRSRRELASRGLRASTIFNHFDFSVPLPTRDDARRALDLPREELLVVQPTRAIARKNVAAALRFAEDLQDLLPDCPTRYWLTGPCEEGYDAQLQSLLGAARVATLHARTTAPGEAYAAADVIVFPSTSEGFGNPVIESVWARRPLAVLDYPVLGELRALGLRFFQVGRPDVVADLLQRGDREGVLAANERIARRELSIEHLPGRLSDLLASCGWSWSGAAVPTASRGHCRTVHAPPTRDLPVTSR